MTQRLTRRLCGFLILVFFAVALVTQANDFLAEPTWRPVPADAVGERLEDYLDSTKIAPGVQAEIRDHWRSGGAVTEGDVLERLAACLAKGEERVAELIDYCATVSKPGALREFAWLADSDTPPLVRHNMRLFFARWLVQQGYYDEALAWTDGLTTEDVIAPEALLFYRAIAHHRLVQPDQAHSMLSQLLEREDELPMRYLKLAHLMRQDLSGLEDESLDHIARRMEDIRRRLAQGRSGERVQGIENGVIKSLDDLIKKIEEQLQQAQSASSAGSQQSGQPMQDSQIAELKGPGKVEPRDIGRSAGWGDLPDKEREKALQGIGREFPSHYREVIEEYFKRLAAEEPADQP
jgi:hypothetical protein